MSRSFKLFDLILVALVVAIPVGSAQAKSPESVLYSFSGGSDGSGPQASLIRDPEGNFYGTTEFGGQDCDGRGRGCGTVFKLTPGGTEIVLHSFAGGNDGKYPDAALTTDTAGNLYGTTVAGGMICGVSDDGCGTVFRLTPDAGEVVLHAFGGGSDGAIPFAGLIRDDSGNLYGTTAYGAGTGCLGGYGCGTVFRLTPDGTEKLLYAFNGSDGANPYALIGDVAGNLYGKTENGGGAGYGVVFKLTLKGRETVLYSFNGGSDGANPYGNLVSDEKGNLFGVTSQGGNSNCDSGCGTVFKLTLKGKEATVYAFTGQSDGLEPLGELSMDTGHNLYGTTAGGGIFGGDCGIYGCGVVFRLSQKGTEKVLHSFTKGSDGAVPVAGVMMDAAGNLYGTTTVGGSSNSGTVFEIRN